MRSIIRQVTGWVVCNMHMRSIPPIGKAMQGMITSHIVEDALQLPVHATAEPRVNVSIVMLLTFLEKDTSQCIPSSAYMHSLERTCPAKHVAACAEACLVKWLHDLHNLKLLLNIQCCSCCVALS